MRAPGVAWNEAERLAALRSYGILDTPEESPFTALTELAAGVLEVPIALVSLIDADRQWFKACYGLQASETSRELSFCGHVVERDESLVVTDTLEDSRFADNPFVLADPRVRFYAGMPLRNSEGFVLGTLCVADTVPKQPTAQQLHLLALLADQVVDQLEARRKRQQLAVERAAAVASARRTGVLFEAMTEGVIVFARNGTIADANSAAGRILGVQVAQMLGRSPADGSWRCVREDGSPLLSSEYPALATLETGRANLNKIVGMYRPSGEFCWLSINALPLADANDERAVLATFHDITAIQLARAAAARQSQERLITTGTLAAGVGHEINNPLAFVLGNLEFALEELRAIDAVEPSARLRDLIFALDEARVGAERIRKIVRGLGALVREETTPVPTDVAAAVEISLTMAAHVLRGKATVVKQLEPVALVQADDSRLCQVLVNLIINAAQAFPSSDVENNHIVIASAMVEGAKVAISVSDNGPGIPEHLLARIFDPFFTTKGPGQGTGLGLSICQGVVTSLGGELRVESHTPGGTTFRVLLPACSGEALGTTLEQRLTDTPTPPAYLGRRGSVLIVDDEPSLLSSMRRVLERDHDVTALVDARVALAHIEAGSRFDVVFCDLMMPGMSGDALYGAVRQLDPALAERFVFITGGVTDGRVQPFLSELPNQRIQKPFATESLRGLVRRFVRAQGRPAGNH
jgi:PAS domain S-box-containing protein